MTTDVRTYLIDNDVIHELIVSSLENPRLRSTYCIHTSTEDKCQRMVSCLQPGTKIPIDSHEIDETIILIEGSIQINIFNEGHLTESIILNRHANTFGICIRAQTQHEIIVLESNTIIFEVKEGPYRMDITNLDKNNK